MDCMQDAFLEHMEGLINLCENTSGFESARPRGGELMWDLHLEYVKYAAKYEQRLLQEYELWKDRKIHPLTLAEDETVTKMGKDE